MSTLSTHPTDREAGLIRLMHQYGTPLLRLCTLYLKDSALAEDALQDTFLKAYRRMDTFRGDCTEQTWLTGIAINTCRDYLRTAWLRHIDRRDITTLPETPCLQQWPDDTVLTQVTALKRKYREVILLRYYQGLKISEIALTLELSPSTVKQRLRKACDILRTTLKEWYDEE